MATFTITLPLSFDVVSRGKAVTIDVAGLTPEIVAKLALHGLGQKVADAAAGAKAVAGEGATDEAIAATGQSLMRKVVDSLQAGNWGVERTGSGVTPLTAAMRAVVRNAVKGKHTKETWKSMDEKDRVAAIDAAIAGLKPEVLAKVTAMAEEKMEEDRVAKLATDKIAAKLGDLDI